MALTRKFLTAMGIEAEKIDEIISAHAETVNALKEERDSYKEEAEKVVDIQKKLDDANDKLSSGDEDAYRTKYEELKEQFDSYKDGIKKQEEHRIKENAYKELLKDAGVSEKRLDTILKVTQLDEVVVGNDGKIENSSELSKHIKEEWADFIVVEGVQGSNPANPPSNTGGSTFKEMTLNEKMAYANANPDSPEVREWLNN